MQKLGLNQSLHQKLSPQQIQFIKLLQVTTAELERRIEEEIEDNPALEADFQTEFQRDTAPEENTNSNNDDELPRDTVESNDDGDYDNDTQEDYYEDLNLSEYIGDDQEAGYKMYGDGANPDDDDRDIPFSTEQTLTESLINQLGFLKLDDFQHKIAEQLIGSIDNDGYIRRDLNAIVNDLAFAQNIITDKEEVETILFKIQTFEPAGIAARNLQECLYLQLRVLDHGPEVVWALKIIEELFDEFTKKHYDKIQKKLEITDEELKNTIHLITHLNPKPGDSDSGSIISQYIIPDFILVNNNSKLDLSLNSKNAPELRVSAAYTEMFHTYDKSVNKDKKLKEAVTFVKQKLDSAKWFIDAIKQRQQTLLKTMHSIIRYQYEFFLEGEDSKLRPMILKDIATDIDMDISTISRVVSSKSIQTEFGIYPLKYFFSEGITSDTGEDISNREIKSILKEIIDAEDKSNPLADDKIERLLKDKGYNIARRTVAKYREQLDLPVARLRKQL